MTTIILKVKVDNVEVHLRGGSRTIGREDLTLSQDFDNMLIRAIDRLLKENRIDRLSLKSLKIQGKTRLGASSRMIMGAIKSGLEV